jgi:hypothetical protein
MSENKFRCWMKSSSEYHHNNIGLPSHGITSQNLTSLGIALQVVMFGHHRTNENKINITNFTKNVFSINYCLGTKKISTYLIYPVKNIYFENKKHLYDAILNGQQI